MRLMVFDIGGTSIKYSVMDETFKTDRAGSVRTPQASLNDLVGTLASIYAQNKDGTDGIAISMPGFIDSENGVLRYSAAMRNSRNIPVARIVSEACGGCPVVIENDAKAATAAELHAGSLRGCRNAAVFVIGTGLGGGLVTGGKVLQGAHRTAGEVSLLNIDADKWASKDGYLGWQCSTSVLLKMYKHQKKSVQDIRKDGVGFFDAVRDDDPDAVYVLGRFARIVAMQAYNLNILLDIEKLAIGGGISRQTILIEKIREAYGDLAEASPLGPVLCEMGRPEIVACHFHNDANQVGAFCAYREAYKNR